MMNTSGNIVRWQRLLAGIVVAILPLTGCSEPTPTPSESPGAYGSGTTATAPTALKNPKVETDGEIGKFGGTLSYTLTGDPKTFNPLIAKETSSTEPLSYVYDGLTETNGITYKVQPALAEKWDVSKDGKTYTFTLREGLQWSDGQPLTADDVVFTFNTILANMKIPTSARDPITIDGQLPKVEKIDDRHVKISVIKPFAPFIRSVGGMGILPKHVLEKTLEPDSQGNPKFNQYWGLDSDVKTIVGTGPFVFDTYVPGQRIVMKRNPYYWRVNKEGKRLPYLDTLIMQIVKDTDSELLRFRGKEIDLLQIRPLDYPLLKPQEQSGNFTIIKGGPTFGMGFVQFNLRTDKNPKGQYYVDPIKQKWFNDKRFRQAVYYALDQETIIKNFQSGQAEPQLSVESKVSPFFNAHVAKYSYDLKKAAQVLQDAGFKKVGDVLQDSSGHPVEFILNSSSEGSVTLRIANVLIADLKKLGMKVTLQPLQFNILVKRIDETNDWESMIMGFTRGVEPNEISNLWESTKSQHMFRMGQKKAGSDWEAEIDKIFQQGRVTLDEKKRKALYDRYQEIAMDQVPLVLLPNSLALLAIRNDVGNVRFNSFAYQGMIFNAWDMYKKS